MTTGTIQHHPFSGPVSLAFTMGAAYPVPLLTEMTLAAELVTVIKVYLHTLGISQKITFLFVMTLNTGQLFVAPTMVNFDIAMGKENAVLYLNLFVGMAGAAPITADSILPGQNLEGITLMEIACYHRLYR